VDVLQRTQIFLCRAVGLYVLASGYISNAACQSSGKYSCSKRASCHRQLPARMLVEVVGDKGKPVVIRFSDSSAEELPVCIDIPDALAKLVASADCGEDCLTLYSTESKL